MRKNKLFLVCGVCLVLLLAAGCGNGGKRSGGNGNNVNDVLQQQINAQGGNAEVETEAETQTTVTPPPPEEADVDLSSTEGVDVDLTLLSGTMLYSQVSYMMQKPEEFLGKIVKIPGNFSVAYSQDMTKQYFGCLVSDKSACCSLGVEFELPGNYSYPDDYPEIDDLITVQGTFDIYDEDGYTYCILRNAILLG